MPANLKPLLFKSSTFTYILEMGRCSNLSKCSRKKSQIQGFDYWNLKGSGDEAGGGGEIFSGINGDLKGALRMQSVYKL